MRRGPADSRSGWDVLLLRVLSKHADLVAIEFRDETSPPPGATTAHGPLLNVGTSLSISLFDFAETFATKNLVHAFAQSV